MLIERCGYHVCSSKAHCTGQYFFPLFTVFLERGDMQIFYIYSKQHDILNILIVKRGYGYFFDRYDNTSSLLCFRQCKLDAKGNKMWRDDT